MMIDVDDVQAELPTDTDEAAGYLVELFCKVRAAEDPDVAFDRSYAEDYYKLYAMAQAILSEEEAYSRIGLDDIEEDGVVNIMATISERFSEIQDVSESRLIKEKIKNLRNSIRSMREGFFYQFSESEISDIQNLINDLRTRISDMTLIEKDHRRRLLLRLEKLQLELHKKVSDLDHFWGLIGDAGVAIGKFGKDAKPIVERIREIRDIIWKVQSRAEGLPSSDSFPMLENTNKFDDDHAGK